MKRILVLQFRKNPQYVADEERVFIRSFEGLLVDIIFKNAVTEKHDWNNPAKILEGADGLILGGSGELDFDGGRDEEDGVVKESCSLAKDMQPFFDYVNEQEIPTLGICYGHQLIAHISGVPVINDQAQAKAGTHSVSLTEEGKSDLLFKDIPHQFLAQYGHKDSLSDTPAKATLLASGDQCLYSALRLGRNSYTVQFHPELIAEDLIARFVRHPDFLPPGKTPEMLVQETPYASKVLRNFAELIVK